MADYNPVPTVSPEGTLSVGVTPEAFGAGSAAALQDIGTETLRFAGDIRENKDRKRSLMNELFANDASTEAMKQVTDLYSKYSRLEGRAASEAFPQFQKDLEGIINNSMATAPSLEAKAKLSGSLKYLQSTYTNYGRSYADTQFKKWQSDSSDQRSEELGTQAVLAVNNPEQMETFLAASDDEVAKKFEAFGYDEASISNAVKNNRGKNTINIVNELIGLGDVEAAFAIFDMQDELIDGGSRAAVLKVLRPILNAKRANLVKDIAIGRSIIDPGVLRAQIQQESGGQTGLTSPKGARGVMQLMPETAKMVAAELGLPYDEARLLTDRNYNMALGMHYMEGLLQQFDGNYVMALAAYNAGPGRVGEWVKRFGDPRTGEISDAEWAASIPFEETRNYVATILNNSGGGYALPREGLPNRADALQAVMDMTEGNYMLRDEAISQLNQEYTVAQAAYVDQQRQQKLYDDALKEADRVAQNEAISDILSPAPTITAGDIAADNRLTPESKRTLVGFMERVTKPEPAATVSRETTAGLMKRITAPYGDPSKLLNLDDVNRAFIDEKLTKDDYSFLYKQFVEAQTPEGAQLNDQIGKLIQRYSSSITKSNPVLGTFDFIGDQNLYDFEQFVRKEVDRYRAGNKDPRALLDPKSPDFVGKPESLAPFQESVQDTIRKGLGVLGNRPAGTGTLKEVEGFSAPVGGRALPEPIKPPTRQPGETIEQFEDRNKQSILNMEDFNRLSLGNKLAMLERFLV